MEKNIISLPLLRRKMAEHGISQTALAREAGVAPSNVSTLMNGKGYLGVNRSMRLQDALHRLIAEATAKAEAKAEAEAAAKAEAEAEAEAEEQEQKPKQAEPNIRRLW